MECLEGSLFEEGSTRRWGRDYKRRIEAISVLLNQEGP